MERITDREAVAKLAQAILGKGERTTKEEAVLELLFQWSRPDDQPRKREVRRRIAKTA